MMTVFQRFFSVSGIPSYARGTFDKQFAHADKVMLRILALHWFAATFVFSISYESYMYGFVSGGLVFGCMMLAYRWLRGTQTMRILVAISLMLFSLIYIQQHLGRIEMHFHVFIAMAILTLYKDPLPVFVAAATTIFHHLVFNYLQLYEVSLFGMPVMIFNYGCGMDIVLLHGIFVLVEAIVLGYIIRLQMDDAIALNESENEIKTLNKELSFSSLHDALTGLPNRYNLQSQLETLVAGAQRRQQKFAVMFLDLDHFKNINDTLGHNVGDELLKKVARKIKAVLRQNDLVSRIGGDEFIIIIGDVGNIGALQNVILKLLEAFRQPWMIKDHELRLSTSIGVALYPDDSKDTDELMKFADMAMYQAKSEGRDQFRFFTGSLNQKIHEEVEIAYDMHRALQENEFRLQGRYRVRGDYRSRGAASLAASDKGVDCTGEVYPYR